MLRDWPDTQYACPHEATVMLVELICYFVLEFLGWVDRAYPTPSDADSVTLIVQKSGSVILECSPNTTESIKGQMPFILSAENKTSTISLPSGNVLMTNVEENTIISCVWPLRQAQSRQFNIIVLQGQGKSVL